MNTNSQETTKPEMTMMSPSPRKRRSRAPAGNPKSLRGSPGIVVQEEETDTKYAFLFNKIKNTYFDEFSRGPKSLAINVLYLHVEKKNWNKVGFWLEHIRKHVFEGIYGQNINEIKIFNKIESEYLKNKSLPTH